MVTEKPKLNYFLRGIFVAISEPNYTCHFFAGKRRCGGIEERGAEEKKMLKR